MNNTIQKCPNCGYSPSSPYVLMKPAIFPNDYEIYSEYIASASEDFICPQCYKKIPEIYSSYIFVFLPTKKIFNYLHLNVQKYVMDHIKNFVNEVYGSNFTIEFSNDLEQVKCKAFMAVLNLVNIQYKGRCGTVIDIIDEKNELLSPKQERDKPYYTALYMLSSRSLGFILPSSPNIDNNLWQQIEMVKHNHTFKGLIKLCIDIIESKQAFDPMEKIENLFIPNLFTNDTISYIANILSKQKSTEYVFDCMLACAALFGGQNNPRSTLWISSLIGMIMYNNWPKNLNLKTATLQKMITADEFISVLDLLGLLQLDESSNDVYIKIGKPNLSTEEKVNLIMKVATKFGYGNELLKFWFESTHITGLDSSKQTPEEFIEYLINLAKERNMSDYSLGESFRLIANISNEDYQQRCLELIFARYGKTNPDVVIPLAQTLARKMMDDRYFSLAIGFIYDIKEAINWEMLTPSSKARFLTEAGNAFRYESNFPKSLSIYEEIDLLIGSDLTDSNVRVNKRNKALVLRDMGQLTDAKKILSEIIVYSEGREKFDCLYALGLIHEFNGDIYAAQQTFEEAYPLIEHTPIDNQIAGFYARVFTNQNYLNINQNYKYLITALKSKLVSDRYKLYIAAIIGHVVFYSNDQNESIRESRKIIFNFINEINFTDLANTDPTNATQWCSTLIAAGKDEIAKKIVDIVLSQQINPRILIEAAINGADITAKNEDWDQLIEYVKKAYEEMVQIVKSADFGDISIRITDTLTSVRRLARYLVNAPQRHEIDEAISIIADLQCSLRLSVDLASEYVPFSNNKDADHLLTWDIAKIPYVRDYPIQIIQFLDAYDYQIPILIQLNNGKVIVKRVNSEGFIDTYKITNIAGEIALKMERMPANTTRDPFEEIDSYNSFKDSFLKIIKNLGIDEKTSILIIPSQAVLGIPFHHIFSEYSTAYLPSISMALALSARANKELTYPTIIGEVISWTFNQNPKLLDIMKNGSEYLKNICNERSLEYQSLSGKNATKQNLHNLLAISSWVKLSCHGLANINSGKFVFLLSDGKHDPPPLENLLYREDLAAAYLYQWEEIAGTGRSCKIVFSTACTSGSSSTTLGGEQIGMARSFFRSGALSYIAPLWPVGGKGAQTFINTLINLCLSKPETPLMIHINDTCKLLQGHIPTYINYAFVLHGYFGPLVGDKIINHKQSSTS